jgi:sec-independent protein translocase protein TatA
MGELSPWHWAIVIGIAMVLFGAKRLPDAARSLGRSARILKAELHGEAPAPAPVAPEAPPTSAPTPAPTPAPAPAATSATAPAATSATATAAPAAEPVAPRAPAS